MADNVWDLSKAIDKNGELSLERNRRDSDPGSQPQLNEFMASDITHPGGFRRHHVSSNPSITKPLSSSLRKNISNRLLNVYSPFIHGMLSQNQTDFDDGVESIHSRIDDLLSGQLSRRSTMRETTPLVSLTKPATNRYATMSQAFLALCKAFVGTGILFLPHAFKSGGMLFSPVVLALVAAMTLFAMIRLLQCQSLSRGTISYGSIGELACGRLGRFAVEMSIVLMQLGFCCSYVIFVATNLQDAFNSLSITPAPSIATLIWLQGLFYLPASWIRHIKVFAFSNLIADVCILYGLGYILIASGWLYSTNEDAVSTRAFNPTDYPIFIGTSVFTFEGIGLVIPTHASLAPQDRVKFQSLLIKLVIGLFCFYTVFAMLEYKTFGEAVAPVVTSSLPQNTGALSVSLCYSLAQMLSFPLFLFPAVNILEGALLKKPTGVSGKNTLHKNIVRSTVVLMTLIIAIGGAANLNVFVSLVGAFCCVPLSFIYPPLFYYLLFPNRSRWSKALDLLVVTIGIATFIFVTGFNITRWKDTN